MRIILYTGKGGVGKTTVAAATALRAAQQGYRTIVFSTDAAHSLADSFDLPLASEPKLITENLWGQEMDMGIVIDNYWGTIQEWMAALMAWRGMDEMMAEEMAIIPGMEELASLLYITEYHDTESYDVIIVDCAPTGETLRLLSFPEILRWWMEKMFPIGHRAAGLLRPVAKNLLNIPMPDDEVFVSVENLFKKLDRMHSILTDKNKASVRLVLNPEKMVVKEAQRTYTYLSLYGYVTDAVVCNRIIPEGVQDSYFDAWKEAQTRYFHLVEEGFAPLPILTVPLMEKEVVGVEMLEKVAERLFGEDDPTAFLYPGPAQVMEKRDGYYLLSLSLPFATKGDISLSRNGDELVVHVGSYKRNILLPQALAHVPAAEAKFEDDRLNIIFRDDNVD
jgi:arsenite-transporting ATPase